MKVLAGVENRELTGNGPNTHRGRGAAHGLPNLYITTQGSKTSLLISTEGIDFSGALK
jgi:hypothetical protein